MALNGPPVQQCIEACYNAVSRASQTTEPFGPSAFIEPLMATCFVGVLILATSCLEKWVKPQEEGGKSQRELSPKQLTQQQLEVQEFCEKHAGVLLLNYEGRRNAIRQLNASRTVQEAFSMGYEQCRSSGYAEYMKP